MSRIYTNHGNQVCGCPGFFPQKEFDRLKGTALANIKQEKVRPTTMVLRVLPQLLYGIGHAYATPLTGSGTAESVGTMTRSDLVKFHQNWFTPNRWV